MIRRYAFIVENDVFMVLSFNDDQEAAPAWVAGLASSPTIVDITSHPGVNQINRGWNWDGENFSAPQ